MQVFQMFIGLKHDGVIFTQLYFHGRRRPCWFIQNPVMFVTEWMKLGGKNLLEQRIRTDTSSSKQEHLMKRQHVTWCTENTRGLMTVVIPTQLSSSPTWWLTVLCSTALESVVFGNLCQPNFLMMNKWTRVLHVVFTLLRTQLLNTKLLRL